MPDRKKEYEKQYRERRKELYKKRHSLKKLQHDKIYRQRNSSFKIKHKINQANYRKRLKLQKLEKNALDVLTNGIY